MGRIFITPLAKKLASLNSINIKDIIGTGPRGRITKIDIEKHIKSPVSNRDIEQKNNFGQMNSIDHEVINVPKIRKIIAEKLTLSKSSIPHFYLRRKARVDELINFRSKTNDLLEKNNKISINDFFIKACACALLDFPDCNMIWQGQHMLKFNEVAIGVAISTETGLYTPTLRNIDKKSLSQISFEMKELIEKAKKKQLRNSDFIDCAHAISNLGMFSVENFDAIINPPNSSILAVGAVKDEVISENGSYLSCKRVYLTLSVDHRTIDGELGAKFLDRIVFYLENPTVLMIK
ncbi:2-oxo acid dehydrogenase subunit E2 [Paracoccaceae bacterium]|nr:2-oxo acid dehydrogenase subunit E2 [Paracoccaceae bacterium]